MLILGNNSAYAPDLFAGAVSQGGGSDIPTTLGSRIDNKATVVGVLQDHEGNDYVLAVVDAAYRSDTPISWGQYGVDTPLENNADETSAKADHHTGKYNTDLILSTYNASDYPAFNFARNACTVILNDVSYYSVLPSMIELQLLYDNKDVLDQYDPTATTYSDRTMSNFEFKAHGAWSSTEKNSDYAWRIQFNGFENGNVKYDGSGHGVCPVICIPLS